MLNFVTERGGVFRNDRNRSHQPINSIMSCSVLGFVSRPLFVRGKMSRSAKKHFLETSFDINPRSSIILVSGFSLILKSMRSVPVPGFRSGRILVRPIPPEAVGSGWWTQVKFFRKFFDFFNTNV